MLTLEQIASLVLLCETLQGEDRHALLSLLADAIHTKIEVCKKHITRSYKLRNQKNSQGKYTTLVFMRKRVKYLRELVYLLKRIYQLDV